jgi:hypothetical protein
MAKQISRVRILRDSHGDIEEVTVGDSLAEILDVDANITARCDLPQLETVTADDFPEDLILQTSSSDGLETYLFHEIEIVSNDGKPSVRFICHHPNKYWEGRWGLATYLGAIRDEVSHCDEIAVEDIDLEDDWKLLALGSSIDAQRPIGEQIREKAKLVREVIGTAEISLEGMRWRPDYENNESLFCTEVLSPLLRRMGFVSVRYLHGVREYGKDFTFSEVSPFSHLRHYGLQAKAGDISGEVNSAIDEIIGQAKDAFAMPYYELGSREPRYISTFVVAISGKFTANAKEKIVHKLPSGLIGSVYFLDRENIIELIDRHWRKT